MRTVSLELVRHGPTHNQLLSPLVDYLAICDNHEVATLHVPFEHEQLLMSLQGLRYLGGDQRDEERRRFELQHLGGTLGQWLSEVPGLLNSLGQAKGELIHLRVVLSAQELALLPFELSIGPNGFPGPGQHVSLQASAPLCLTRESRRATREFYADSEHPRVLFVFANFPNAEVPYKAHLLALRAALAPWLPKQNARASLDSMLTVLPNATLRDIADACRKQEFSHVHILAHGSRLDPEANSHLTVMLPNADGTPQNVTGRNLARALRPLDSEAARLLRPQVVTLATCDSAAATPIPLNAKGNSIGHALHESGIPMVVGSQFPLTFEGSVVMVQTLYRNLLRARDPREALVDCRRELALRVPTSHDWASLVCYLSLSAEFEAGNRRVRIKRLSLQIETSLAEADLHPERARDIYRQAIAELDRADDNSVLDPDRVAGLAQVRAAVFRRYAGLLYLDRDPKLAADRKTLGEVSRHLRNARDAYLASYRNEPESHWVLNGILRSDLLLQQLGGKATATDEVQPQVLWDTKQGLSLLALQCSDEKQRAWALADLQETHILAPSVYPRLKDREARAHHDSALGYARELRRMGNAYATILQTALRQAQQYDSELYLLLDQRTRETALAVAGELSGAV